mgnify:CR=1 FL=1
MQNELNSEQVLRRMRTLRSILSDPLTHSILEQGNISFDRFIYSNPTSLSLEDELNNFLDNNPNISHGTFHTNELNETFTFNRRGVHLNTSPSLSFDFPPLQRMNAFRPESLEQALAASFNEEIKTTPLNNRIKTTLPKIKTTLLDTKEMCIICHADYKVDENKCVLKCTHQFHYDCIISWFNKSHTCPTCRHDLNKERPTQPPHIVRKNPGNLKF